MFGFLGQPYVFVVVAALLTAGLSVLVSRFTARPGRGDPDPAGKVFYKTLAAGLVAGLGLAWLAGRQEQVATQPFLDPGMTVAGAGIDAVA